MRPRLERELAECCDRVEFVGFKDWPELPAFYHEADLLCVPSRHDGWGLVVPEGLAAGLPVISTARTGAALDLIQPGQNGWLIKAGDEVELARALERVAALSAAELSECSAAAVRSVANHSLADGVKRFNSAVTATP